MATAPTFVTAPNRNKPNGPEKHVDYPIYEAAITDTRKVFRINAGGQHQGWQSLLKIEDAGTLDALVFNIWGVKKHPTEDVEVLLHSETFTATTNPDVPSDGATGFVGETLYVQDPWGKYDEILVDLDATGATGINYTATGVVTTFKG